MADLNLQGQRRAVLATRKLPVGKTVGYTLSVVGRNWVKFYVLSLIVAVIGIPSAVLLAEITQAVRLAQTTRQSPDLPPGIFGEMGATYLVQTVVSLVVFGTISYLAIRDRHGENAGLGSGVKVGLFRFFPVLGSALVLYIMMIIGFVLIIIPGIIVGAVYGLAPTLCVIERRGPFASLSRSADLTRSNRFRCIAATLILLLVPAIVSAVIQVLAVAFGGPQVKTFATLFGSFLILPIIYSFPAVLTAELKEVQEGSPPSAVAEVF